MINLGKGAFSEAECMTLVKDLIKAFSIISALQQGGSRIEENEDMQLEVLDIKDRINKALDVEDNFSYPYTKDWASTVRNFMPAEPEKKKRWWNVW